MIEVQKVYCQKCDKMLLSVDGTETEKGYKTVSVNSKQLSAYQGGQHIFLGCPNCGKNCWLIDPKTGKW
jgi:phage FluMu protein Com